MKAARLLLRLPRARSSPRGIVRTNLRRPTMSLFDQCKGVAVRKSIPAVPKPEPPNCRAGVRVCGD
jgi:hypothetical protein